MEKKTLNVEGMSCDHCVKAVNNALGGINGVTNTTVSLKDKTVSFDYDSALVQIETIKAAITDAGFDVV
jgi:copper chaperone